MRIISPAAVAAADCALLDSIAESREMVVAAGDRHLAGASTAALLFADFAVATEEAEITIDSPEAWAGAVARIGRRALRLHLFGTTHLRAEEAVREGLVDDVVPAGADPLEWIDQWIGKRDHQALDAAAVLIRSRGGDVLERAEFARLFALGNPQRGMDAFLRRKL